MQRVASFDLSPPLAAPLRFFLTAPAFAMAAGLLLAATGTDGLASRWSPTTLALTHLMTLGFLGMAMLGALIQILPVVAGVAVAGTARTARGHSDQEHGGGQGARHLHAPGSLRSWVCRITAR